MYVTTFEARDFSDGNKVPEDQFSPFVLPPRSIMRISTLPELFFLKNSREDKNLSMYEAALEVNHW
jgi:hypothetical protein